MTVERPAVVPGSRALVWPWLALSVLGAAARVGHLSWGDDFGVRVPSLASAGAWGAGFVALVVAQEVIGHRLWSTVDTWPDAWSGIRVAVRAVTIVVAAPISEELLYRGLLFTRIADWGGVVIAVAFTAIVSTIAHGRRGATVRMMILADAAYYGCARAVTGSVVLPIAFHCVGNAYAVYERTRRSRLSGRECRPRR
ncbi:MAG TPA: CPBP family intramembrane glutamic endopeptidase [Acidimicrobiales bacterium]|nr:CPBP family intramembrane glutamic endopeptidase [Acidimicrobiales bacterium]